MILDMENIRHPPVPETRSRIVSHRRGMIGMEKERLFVTLNRAFSSHAPKPSHLSSTRTEAPASTSIRTCSLETYLLFGSERPMSPVSQNHERRPSKAATAESAYSVKSPLTQYRPLSAPLMK